MNVVVKKTFIGHITTILSDLSIWAYFYLPILMKNEEQLQSTLNFLWCNKYTFKLKIGRRKWTAIDLSGQSINLG